MTNLSFTCSYSNTKLWWILHEKNVHVSCSIHEIYENFPPLKIYYMVIIQWFCFWLTTQIFIARLFLLRIKHAGTQGVCGYTYVPFLEYWHLNEMLTSLSQKIYHWDRTKNRLEDRVSTYTVKGVFADRNT